MSQYQITNYMTYSTNEKGETELLANFAAEITHEVRYIDGRTTDAYVTISGLMPGEKPDKPIELPPVEVPMATFLTMSWIMPAWGVQAILSPGSGVKEQLRTAIQLMSRDVQITNIYRHTGWQTINGQEMFLHAEGAIGKKGNVKDIQVMLPTELSRYDLTPDPDVKIRDAVKATLALIDSGPPEIMWPMFAATIAPILGPVDFAVHLSGRTGTYKSELSSLFQSHFGPEMDARHLPASWSSTPNAIEALAYLAKNVPMILDDFVPQGTAWSVRSLQANADKIIRAQGNQAGRARLTDTSKLQETMYPRGIIMSTGEDTPEGQSVRARMLILELAPGDIEPAKLTAAQEKRGLYVTMTAAYIQSIAAAGAKATFEMIKQKSTELRNVLTSIGHARTPSMIARMYATIEHWLDWLVATKIMSSPTRSNLMGQADTAFQLAAAGQSIYLEAADPCDQFLAAIRQTLGVGAGHLKSVNGGVPRNAGILGWTEGDSRSDIPVYSSKGPCIGWIDWESDEMYIDITVGMNVIRKQLGNDMACSRITLLKRLKDAGTLLRTDENRQRNTVRITAEGHARQVLVLSISGTLENQETPSSEGE